jgi:hypothetical protein
MPKQRKASKMSDAEIDNKVELWHTGLSKMELHEFLGMTLEEYGLWLRNPEAWRNANKKSSVVRNRKTGKKSR